MIKRAHNAYLAGNYSAAKKALAQVDTNAEAWERRYLTRLMRSESMEIPFASKTSRDQYCWLMAFSPDSKYLLLADGGDGVSVVSPKDGVRLHRILVHPQALRENHSPVETLAIDETGRYMISMSQRKGDVVLTDLLKGTVIHRHQLEGEVNDLYSPIIIPLPDFRHGTIATRNNEWFYEVNEDNTSLRTSKSKRKHAAQSKRFVAPTGSMVHSAKKKCFRDFPLPNSKFKQSMGVRVFNSYQNFPDR